MLGRFACLLTSDIGRPAMVGRQIQSRSAAAHVTLHRLLDTGKTMVDLVCGWDIILVNHSDAFSLLDSIPAILPGEFAASCSTIYIVQCCYLHTIWKFLKQSNRSRYWPLAMLPPFLLASGSFGMLPLIFLHYLMGKLMIVKVAGLVATIQIQTAENIFDSFPRAKVQCRDCTFA
ncbi:hypothetical protein C8Q72DRAFT_158680 [Fomitopsis betulina]|nr:hypothetical protein C8Q72DRAFT_158680 [Fomitopsis betulina]